MNTSELIGAINKLSSALRDHPSLPDRWVPLRAALTWLRLPGETTPAWLIHHLGPYADGAVRGVIEDALVNGGFRRIEITQFGSEIFYDGDAISLCLELIGILEPPDDALRQ